MSTINEVITDALEITGMKSPHEDLTTEWGAIGLRRINSILDGWNVDKTRGYAINELEFPLVANQSTYTIGSGGDFDAQRPVKIEYAYVVDSAGVKHRIGNLDYQSFHEVETENITASYPDCMWYNPKSPLGEISFYPTPTNTYTVHFDVCFGFAPYALGTDTLVVPQGYERLLTYQLATELCSHRGKQIPPAVYKVYKETECNIESINFDLWMPETKILTPNTNTVAESNCIWMNRGI